MLLIKVLLINHTACITSIRILYEFDEIIGSVGDRLATARGRAASNSGRIGERHDAHMFLPKAYGDISDAYGNTGCVRPRPITIIVAQ